jgi:hypothetical protein
VPPRKSATPASRSKEQARKKPLKPLKPSLDDTRFQAASRLEEPDAVQARLRAGRVTALNAGTMGLLTNAQQAAPGKVRRTDVEVTLSVTVPEYVIRQLRHRYADTRTTLRNQVLLALKQTGIEVRDEDITDQRRRKA